MKLKPFHIHGMMTVERSGISIAAEGMDPGVKILHFSGKLNPSNGVIEEVPEGMKRTVLFGIHIGPDNQPHYTSIAPVGFASQDVWMFDAEILYNHPELQRAFAILSTLFLIKADMQFRNEQPENWVQFADEQVQVYQDHIPMAFRLGAAGDLPDWDKTKWS